MEYHPIYYGNHTRFCLFSSFSPTTIATVTMSQATNFFLFLEQNCFCFQSSKQTKRERGDIEERESKAKRR